MNKATPIYHQLRKLNPYLTAEQVYNLGQMVMMCVELRQETFESVMTDESLYCYGLSRKQATIFKEYAALYKSSGS